MTTIAFIGFVALILFLYQRNFRSGERGAAMAKKQIPWVAVYVALAAVLIGGGEALLRVVAAHPLTQRSKHLRYPSLGGL